VLERLDLVAALRAAGGVPNHASWWAEWGWITPDHDAVPVGLNLRRQTLDPLLRRRAAAAPGVDLMPGRAVTAVLERDGRVHGIRATYRDKEFELTAPLVVGADGRFSAVAAAAGIRTGEARNLRFGYFTYFRDLPEDDGLSRAWYMGPDCAFSFINEDGIRVVVATPDRANHLAAFRTDPATAFRDYIRALPDAPRIEEARQISKIIGITNFPLFQRVPWLPGLALIGDAALTTDPIWGIGGSWALQSAEWLVDAVSESLDHERELDSALRGYGAHRTRALRGHQSQIRRYARARGFNAAERLMFSAAARDKEAAAHLYRFGSRLITPAQLLAPRAVLRAGRVNLAHASRLSRSDAPPPSGFHMDGHPGESPRPPTGASN
jgi:menaquinone-9 beta-reductase